MKKDTRSEMTSEMEDIDTRMESPPIGSKVGSTAHQSQPLQARSSNSGTSFKKSDISQSSCQGTGDNPSEQATGWIKSDTVNRPAHGHLTTAFTQQAQTNSASVSAKNQMAPKRPSVRNQGNSQAQSGSMGTATRGSTASTSRARSNSNQNERLSCQNQGQKDVSMASTAANSSRRLVTEIQSHESSLGGRSAGQQKPAAKGKSSTFNSQTGKAQTSSGSKATSKQSDSSGKAQKGTAGSSGQQNSEMGVPLTGLHASRQTKSENTVPMRQTRSKSKSMAVSVTNIDSSPPKNEQSQGTQNQGDVSILSERNEQAFNGQSETNEVMQCEADVGKHESKQSILLNLHHCEEMEDCKIAKNEVGSRQRVNSVSFDSGSATRKVEKQSNTYQISESADSLAENPYNTLIKQFQQQRTNAQLTGKNKPKIQQFQIQFEKEMLRQEEYHQQQNLVRKEQMRLFEQQHGNAKTSRAISNNKLSLPAKQYEEHATPIAAKTAYKLQEGNTMELMPSLMKEKEDQNILTVGHETTQSMLGPLPEEGSVASHHSSLNNNNMSMNGALFSEMSVSEVYESYHFMQNSLISFYPKDVRRCFQRRRQINNTQLSSDKVLNSLKAPKHNNKARKVAQKMQSLAMCQMNMMQVLLQKVSRRSKAIRKQEKFINDNLKRKRIYLERENFNILKVLNSIQSIEKGQSHHGYKRRQSSPTFNLNLSQVADKLQGESKIIANQSQISNEDYIPEEQQLRKTGKQFSAQENTVSTTFGNEIASQRAIGSRQEKLPKTKESVDKVPKTPEKARKRSLNAEEVFMQAEKVVQKAFNLSEIEDSFFKSKNFSQRPEDSAYSGSQETSNQKKLGVSSMIEPDCIESNYAVNMMTPERMVTTSGVPLGSDICLPEDQDHKIQFTAAPSSSHNLIKDSHDELKHGRLMDGKNAQTQHKIDRKSGLSRQGSHQSDAFVGVSNLSAKLNGVSGTYAIADLEKRGQEVSSPVTMAQIKREGDGVSEQIRRSDDQNQDMQKSGPSKQIKLDKNSKSKAIKKTHKINKQNSDTRSLKQGKNQNQKSHIKNKTENQLNASSQIENQIKSGLIADEKIDHKFEAQQNKMSPLQDVEQINQENAVLQNQHQPLTYSQSMRLPHHNMANLVLGVDQPMFGLQQMQENINMEEFAHTNRQAELMRQTTPQPAQIGLAGNTIGVPNQSTHQMFDMAMARSHSMMVPQPSYNVHHGIDDMFLDESPGEVSSVEQNPQASQYVANPYEAAKRSYFAQQKKRQASQVNAVSSTEKENDHMQLVKQQASDPSSYTAQEANNHSLPQAQDVHQSQVDEVAQHQSLQQHPLISPMPLGQISRSQTPLNKIPENIPLVEATPSKFMGGVVVDQSQHLSVPYMQHHHNMSLMKILLSGGIQEDDFNQMDSEVAHAHAQAQHQLHHPQGVVNSAMSGASVLFRGANNYTPAGLLGGQHHITETHRQNLNVNAWNLDDHETQTANIVESIIGNSAQTISEEQARQHSSSQQRSAEGEVENLLQQNFNQQQSQQHQFM